MSGSPDQSTNTPRDAAYWAGRVDTLKVAAVPAGAINLNVDGRRVVGPVQGFGQLWQKTYRVRLNGAHVTPQDVVRVWKERFPHFHPPQNRFFPSLLGVAPGEVVLINAVMPGMQVSTGVLVLYADDESFTLITPEGHPESGWITFSAYTEAGVTVAQVQSIARANDPLYEFGFRLFGSRAQEQIWRYVLTSLAAHWNVKADVSLHKTCVDPRCQWRHARNMWHNAAIRSALYTVSAPVRWVRKRKT
jgi:hypothetical protein